MNEQHLSKFSLDSNQVPPMMIPPPPLPPMFPPPCFNALAFPPPPTNTPTFHGSATWPPLDHQPTTEPQQVVNSLLKNKKIPVLVKEPNNRIKIYEVKEKVIAVHSLIKELENGARTLSVMAKTVTPHEWDQKCNEIENKKKELSQVLNDLKLSKEEFHEIKLKCLKRSKKRARLKRQSTKRKLQKENKKVEIQNLHFRIDNWQKEMQEVVERNKIEKELQQEADAVLWGVRHRMAEARRHLELLSTLQELREARVRRRSAAGQSTSTVEIQTFTQVTQMLKSLWSRYLSECQLEEQALRGMLAESEVSVDAVATFKKLVLQEWQVALFGAGGSSETSSSLVDIRRTWDQFVVDEHTVLASAIPPGWVLPVPPSSQQWQSLLKYT